MDTNWFEIKDVDQLDSPALVIFPDRVKANIQLAIEMAGSPDRLRPHVKTHKSPDVTRLMLAAGITKFKCATIAEAEMLAACGASDVLLAYQPLGPKLARFISLIQRFPRTSFACLIDNRKAAEEQSQGFSANGVHGRVFIDLNVGMNRTGIPPDQQAVSLAQYCEDLSGLTLEGLHAYDGHIRDSDFEAKKKNCDAAFALVEKLNERLQLPTIVAGGSPTFSVHCSRPGIECSPGTFVYWDKGYTDLCPEQHFLPAAVLVTRVISVPGANKFCLDLGHKSVAAENEITRRIYFLNAVALKPVSQSEEHLVVESDEKTNLANGSILYGLPFHVCPTVALYERVTVVRNGKIEGEWKTIARDRKISV